jgi:hypothetical protein
MASSKAYHVEQTTGEKARGEHEDVAFIAANRPRPERAVMGTGFFRSREFSGTGCGLTNPERHRGNQHAPPEAVLSVTLSNSLDAKKCKVNDRIEVKTVTDLWFNGRIVVQRSTKIVGHITEAKAHSKTSPGSTVGIAFDGMLLKDGREVPLQMMIQAVARPLHLTPYQSGPDTLADRSMSPAALPGVGAQATAAGSSSLPPDYGNNVPAPPSINTRGPASSTVGPLNSTSRGVVGMKGLSLDTSGPASVLSSSTGNLHLDSGTQLILRLQ